MADDLITDDYLDQVCDKAVIVFIVYLTFRSVTELLTVSKRLQQEQQTLKTKTYFCLRSHNPFVLI